MIVNRIYEWAKCQPDNTAVIWKDVSVSYLSFANAIRATIEFFQGENLSVGRTATVLVHNLLDGWLIIMALRALGLNTISVTSIAAADALKFRDVACIVITQTEAPLWPDATKAPTGAKIVVVPQLHCAGPPEDLHPSSSNQLCCRALPPARTHNRHRQASGRRHLKPSLRRRISGV